MRRHRDFKTTTYTIHKGNESALKQRIFFSQKNSEKQASKPRGDIIYFIEIAAKR